MRVLMLALLLTVGVGNYANACADSKTSNVEVDAVHQIGGCAFQMENVDGGKLDVDNDRKYGSYLVGYGSDTTSWGVQMFCESLRPGLLEDAAGISQQGNGYVLSNQAEQFIPEQHVKLIRLASKNWTGGGTLTDSTTGEPFERFRRFHFCLVHRDQALCGWSDVVPHLSNPSKSSLGEVLKLIKSVEFVDDWIPTSVVPH
jgi:hypothetical protein